MNTTRTYATAAHGLSGQSTVEQARASAITHAVRIAGISGAVWPHQYDAFIRIVSDQLIAELIAFSIHARRVLEITKTRGVKLPGRLYSLAAEARDAEYEDDLWNAVNKIIHARDIGIHSVERDTVRFAKMGDHHILHARVQSDLGDAVLICPTALVYAFLEAETAVKQA